MSIKDTIDLLFAARERIDFYWNFYVVVVIAIVGWIATRKEPLTRPTKWLVTIAYVVAAATNVAGLYASYALAEALRTDILRITVGSSLIDTRAILVRHSYPSQRVAALTVHVTVGVTLLTVLW